MLPSLTYLLSESVLNSAANERQQMAVTRRRLAVALHFGTIADIVVPALDGVLALTRAALRRAIALLTEAPTEAAGHGCSV